MTVGRRGGQIKRLQDRVSLTFDDLLGTGIVDLLLGCVGWQDSVKHIRLALHEKRRKETVKRVPISLHLSFAPEKSLSS